MKRPDWGSGDGESGKQKKPIKWTWWSGPQGGCACHEAVASRLHICPRPLRWAQRSTFLSWQLAHGQAVRWDSRRETAGLEGTDGTFYLTLPSDWRPLPTSLRSHQAAVPWVSTVTYSFSMTCRASLVQFLSDTSTRTVLGQPEYFPLPLQQVPFAGFHKVLQNFKTIRVPVDYTVTKNTGAEMALLPFSWKSKEVFIPFSEGV